MAINAQKINPCLWFDTEAEDAAKFYCSVFKNSKLGTVSRYVDEGQEIHGKPAGSVMAVEFELEGRKFAALNGGPHFKFDEAISFQIACASQKEIDYFWSKLSEGGSEGRFRRIAARPDSRRRARPTSADHDPPAPSSSPASCGAVLREVAHNPSGRLRSWRAWKGSR